METREKSTHQKKSASLYSIIEFIVKNSLSLFVLKALKNQPGKAYELLKMRFKGPDEIEKYLGKEAVAILEELSPNLNAVIEALSSSNQDANIDELYEIIKPKLDAVFSQTLKKYGVSFKETGFDKNLTESYLKKEVLPIFITVRDIPKFFKSVKEKRFLQTIRKVKEQLTTHLETNLHSDIRKYLVPDQNGLYKIDPQEPALVLQIKKILNALTYAEKVISFINSMDLNPDSGFRLKPLLDKKGVKQVEFLTKVIWYLAVKDSDVGKAFKFELDLEPDEIKFIRELNQAIMYAREAQSSLLEVDLPVYQIFGSELKVLIKVFGELEKFTAGHSKELESKLGTTEKFAETASHYAAKPAGKLFNYLKPTQGKIDYSFLAPHLGLLPGYLDILTQLLYSYGAGKPDKALALSEADSEKFKNSAIKLFFELSNYHDFFFWQKGISLAFPIRKELVVLGQGIIEQGGRVKAAVEEMVAYQLSRLKNELFTKIISESDKFELYLGLTPGALTKPLILQLNGLYQTLVVFANSVIDTKGKFADLLQLDNTSFLTRRLEGILQQKNSCQQKLDRAKKAKQDLDQFIDQFSTDKAKINLDKVKSLYHSFKHYVIEYNPRLSVLIDTFFNSTSAAAKLDFSADDLALMTLAVRKLCNKDIATFECYLNLADNRLLVLPKQTKGKLYPYSSQKVHSMLIIDEPQWLLGTRSSTSRKHEFIEDLTSLTDEDSAELYNYHCTRALTLKHIRKEITAFLKRLGEPDCLSRRDKISFIIERYRIIQPYLVDALQNTRNYKIDQDFIDLLEQLPLDDDASEKQVATLDALKVGMKLLKEKIDMEVNRSNTRQNLFESAHLKIREEHSILIDKAPLTLNSDIVLRQNKWIRHKKLSQASDEMKKALLKMLAQFDPSLQLSSVNSDSDNEVPFPEMENSLEALKVATQVSWIKRMINVIYYIHSNFKYLESLDRNIHETSVTHFFLKGVLVEGIYQIKPFLELTKAYQTLMELMNEPTGQVLLATLQSRYSNLMEVWGTLKPLYFVSPETVPTKKPAAVTNNGVWYPLVSLLVLPEHLTALSSRKSFDPTSAQEKAKQMTAYVEKILGKFQAGQYFSLFINSPTILFKFLPELKAKIDRFSQDTHGIVIDHLLDIQNTLHDILLETDALEERLGLTVGLISNPTKLVLDKLFNSFIEPLNISLKEAAQLALDISSYKKRLDVNKEKQKETQQLLEGEKKTFDELDQLLTVLTSLKTKVDTHQEISDAEKTEFKELYWKSYPLLQSQQGRYVISMDQRDKSTTLDQLCHQCFSEKKQTAEQKGRVHHYTKLRNVMYLVKHVHAAKMGNINSLKLASKYLISQERSIVSAKTRYIKKEGNEALMAHIKHAIDVQIDKICKQANQSVYFSEEFRTRLSASLLAKKKEILAKANSIPIKDLENMISLALQEQFNLFSQTEYAQLNHLDRILTEVERFQSYCQNEKLNPVFENVDPVTGTLQPKIDLLQKLKNIAENKEENGQPRAKPLSLKERIDLIKLEAKKDTFNTILMSHDNYFRVSLKTLKRLFLNIFNSIFNFFGVTRRPADIYKSLDKAIKNKKPKTTHPLFDSAGFFTGYKYRNNKLSDKSSDKTMKPTMPLKQRSSVR